MSSTENNNLNATVETGIDHDSLARIDSITDAVGHSKGPVLNGGYTDDLQPTLSGRLPMGEGQVLRVFCNNVVIGYADIGDDATWSFTPDTPLEPGRTYDFQIILLDSGTSELLPSDTYTIHTTELNQDAAPVAPVITEVLDQSGDHQGLVAQGGKTDDKQPEISGTAQAGSVVTVTVYSDVHHRSYTLGSVVADADGHWSYQMHGSQDITNGLGEWTFTATATNSMGTSDSSAGYSVETVATNADVFATPEISYIIDDVGLHTGHVTDGGKTDDRQPELHGTGEPGSVVTVTMYGPSTGKTYTLGHITVGNDGTWSYQFSGKQAMQASHGAENIFHVSSVDTDGHTVTSDAFTVTLTGSNADDNTPPDITPPDAPVITEVYDDVGTQQGPVANGGSTDDSQLKISVTASWLSVTWLNRQALLISMAPLWLMRPVTGYSIWRDHSCRSATASSRQRPPMQRVIPASQATALWLTLLIPIRMTSPHLTSRPLTLSSTMRGIPSAVPPLMTPPQPFRAMRKPTALSTCTKATPCWGQQRPRRTAPGATPRLSVRTACMTSP
ncbi:hypothetical protein D6C13_23640 [Rahnella woolbedingensis]|uniref:Bacterial Ig-like domain-containing protein n=1 Tax=Rahnella woolbedingensis TaxID=1510574 RepID=A0A419N2D7_9GAMM|nr:hypothetical protein D6C13_23640 [Rahnella woolbedingensis]